MEAFAARWISTALRTTKALPPPPPRAVLFFSFHYGTATSPQPPDDPSPQTDRLSHAHVHASVCTKKENLQTHTGQTGVSRLCFYAVPLSTNSD